MTLPRMNSVLTVIPADLSKNFCHCWCFINIHYMFAETVSKQGNNGLGSPKVLDRINYIPLLAGKNWTKCAPENL